MMIDMELNKKCPEVKIGAFFVESGNILISS